jgi:hypothetical protein
MASKDVLINIKANTANIKSKLKGISSQSQMAGQSVKKSFASIKASALVAVGAITGIVMGMKKMVKIAVEDMAMERKLWGLIKNRADGTKKVWIEHIALARQLQKETNYSNTEIMNVISQFQTFGNISQGTAKKATRYVLDIAQTTGQSVTSVSIQMAKALSAPLKMASSLRRSGIMFDENKLKSFNTLAERQAYLLQEIQAQYSGAARGAVDPLKQFSNELADITKDFGKALIPVFKAIFPIIKSAVKAFGWLTESFSSLLGFSKDFGDQMKELQVAMAEFDQQTQATNAQENLIDTYERLSKKQNRSIAENQQLQSAIAKLAKEIPTAIQGFDGMGRAIAINTQEARRFIKTQREISDAALQNQFQSTLGGAEDRLKKFSQLQKIQAGGGAGVLDKMMGKGGGMFTSVIGIFEYMRNFGSQGSRNQVIQDMQKLIKMYPELYQAAMKMNTISNTQAERLFTIAKAAGQASESIKGYWMIMLRGANQSYKVLAKLTPNFLKLTAPQQQQIARSYFRGGGMGEVDMNTVIKKQIDQMAANNARRRSSAANASNASNWNSLMNSMQGFLDKLREINKSKIELKVTKKGMELLKAFGATDRQMRSQEVRTVAFNAVWSGNTSDVEELRRLLGATTGKKKAFFDLVIKNLPAFRKQLSESVKKAVEESNKVFRQYIGLDMGFASMVEQEQKAIDAIEKYRKNKYEELLAWRRDNANTVTDAEFDERRRRLDEEVRSRKKMIRFQGALKRAGQATSIAGNFAGVADQINSIKYSGGTQTQRAYGAFKAWNTGVKNSKIPFASQAAGVIEGIMTIGETAKSIFGGKTKEQKKRDLQKQMQLYQAMYQYIMYQEQKYLRSMQNRIDLLEFEKRLYFEIGNEKARQAAEETGYNDIILQFEQKYGKLTKEQMKDRYKELQIQRDALNDRKAQLQYNQAIAQFMMEDASQAVAMTQLQTLELEKQLAGREQEMKMIDMYLDAQTKLYELDQNRTNELREQLGLQLKLSDELLKQLRALGNQDINNLIDQMYELERKIAVGVVREGSSEARMARTEIMNRIMAILGMSGETQLGKAVEGARGQYLSDADKEKFLKLAGFGKVVTFATGGYTGDGSGIAGLVHEGETVLNSGLTTAFSKGLGVHPSQLPGALTNALTQKSNVTLSPTVNINGQTGNLTKYDIENAVIDAMRKTASRMGGRIKVS